MATTPTTKAKPERNRRKANGIYEKEHAVVWRTHAVRMSVSLFLSLWPDTVDDHLCFGAHNLSRCREQRCWSTCAQFAGTAQTTWMVGQREGLLSSERAEHLVLNKRACHIFTVHHLYCVHERRAYGRQLLLLLLLFKQKKKKRKKNFCTQKCWANARARNVINNYVATRISFIIIVCRPLAMRSDVTSLQDIHSVWSTAMWWKCEIPQK